MEYKVGIRKQILKKRKIPAMSMDKCICGYSVSNLADGKSLKTVSWYEYILRDYLKYLKVNGYSLDISSFSIEVVRSYINHLRNRRKYTGHPHIPRQESTVSAETVRCHVRGLKAFSSWIYQESYVGENRLVNLRQPRVPTKIMTPLTPAEINQILHCIKRDTYTGERNYVLTVTLLDTGLRVSEISGIKLRDLDIDKGHIRVMGKGSKERVVPVGRYVQALLIKFIEGWRSKMADNDSQYLFLTIGKRPVTANAIKLIFKKLAGRSGITRLHAHLCRHTFAINYLLNGGDVFSLKEILGHTTLEMVNHYLHFTSSQITEQHRKYSPMDRINKDRISAYKREG